MSVKRMREMLVCSLWERNFEVRGFDARYRGSGVLYVLRTLPRECRVGAESGKAPRRKHPARHLMTRSVLKIASRGPRAARAFACCTAGVDGHDEEREWSAEVD